MHCKDSTNIKEQNQISTKQRPIRIIHVVGGMNRGGIETWLMHVLRHIDRDRLSLVNSLDGSAKGRDRVDRCHNCPIYY